MKPLGVFLVIFLVLSGCGQDKETSPSNDVPSSTVKQVPPEKSAAAEKEVKKQDKKTSPEEILEKIKKVKDEPKDPPIPKDMKLSSTKSGLKYSILKKGKAGPYPGLTDICTVHYTGWLRSGKVFDSSKKRGKPDKMKPLNVPPGWREGLQLMTPGSVFKFTMSPLLASGEKGDPRKGAPDKSAVIYEIELLDVEKGHPLPPFRNGNVEKQETTKSGLIYEILTPGEGKKPKKGDNVEIEFTFWSLDGKVISTTETPNRTFKFSIGKSSLGIFNEGVQLMQAGSRYRFEVPPKLAYGKAGFPPLLPADTITVWEVELLKILEPFPVPEFHLSSKDKIKTTKSGLQYEVIKEGKGKSPKIGQKALLHYAGWLENGILFDSSYQRGEKAVFDVGRGISGWGEALQIMKEGATYRFMIPPELGYGPQGMPPKIPGNAKLIFQVELFEVSD